jgi:hypothetical protein
MRNSRTNREHTAEELLEIARGLSQKGNLQKARLKLLTAIGRAEGPCPDCHRELATVYEKMARYADAITEWESFIQQSAEGAPVEQAKARIETLKQKSNPGH